MKPPKRYLIAYAPVHNNSTDTTRVVVTFYENPPDGVDEAPLIVGTTDVIIPMPKFKKYEFEGNNSNYKRKYTSP